MCHLRVAISENFQEKLSEIARLVTGVPKASRGAATTSVKAYDNPRGILRYCVPPLRSHPIGPP
jgi:hypothetical protein